MSKGFLFTFGVIFLASTMLIFAQFFSSISISHEREVLLGSRTILPLFLQDDLSFDLPRVLGVSVDFNQDRNYVLCSGYLSPTPSQRVALIDYNSFVNQNYLSSLPGTNNLNLSELLDGQAEIFFGENSGLKLNYDSNSVVFYSSSSVSLIDVNVTSGLSGPYALVESVSSGSSTVNIRYNDDANVVVRSISFNPSLRNSFVISYSDSNIEFVFGNLSYGYGLLIDSNSSAKHYFSFDLNYSSNDFRRGRINSVLSAVINRVDFNGQLLVN